MDAAGGTMVSDDFDLRDGIALVLQRKQRRSPTNADLLRLAEQWKVVAADGWRSRQERCQRRERRYG
jgi:hypothetical protein